MIKENIACCYRQNWVGGTPCRRAKKGRRSFCKFVRRVIPHLLRVLELWHYCLVVLPGAALGVAAHGLDVLLQGPERRGRGRNLDSCVLCSKKIAFLGEKVFCFFSLGSLVSKDGQSGFSRILMPSPNPTAGLCPKTLHLDLVIPPP